MSKYLDLDITLKDAPYPIQRLLRIPAATDLHQLHNYIQLAMGWQLSHLHVFVTQKGNFSDYEDDFDPSDDQPECDVPVVHVLSRKGSEITYVYDFGDDWVHTVRHKGSVLADDGQGVTLLDANGACPEEDSGGVWNLPKRSQKKPDMQLIQARLNDFYHLTVDLGMATQPAFCHVHGVDDD